MLLEPLTVLETRRVFQTWLVLEKIWFSLPILQQLQIRIPINGPFGIGGLSVLGVGTLPISFFR